MNLDKKSKTDFLKIILKILYNIFILKYVKTESMNISRIKLQPGLFRHRIYKGMICSVRAKLWHIKKALSS